MDVIEKAGTVYEDGSVERCVGFVFNKRVADGEAFEPQVNQAMREYLAAKSVREPYSNQPDPDDGFVASNGVTVSLAIFDAAELEHSEEERRGFYVIDEADWPLADAELTEVENAKPNPGKTA